ncbi:MAG: diaminopimelate epimerase [Flavobacteriaceae bacterium]|nr:diaminopimelate epimerase [Flavobacteriaceae bacterium]MDG1091828.1 diaminopimelate epimerase [Flavobacteriaceae bacterium]
MEQEFYKYQGTGNDFILIDDRSLNFPEKDVSLVARLCDRRFGIGADGLILIQNAATSDFKMLYFNADGNESTLCGNGARCTIAFANFLNCIKNKTTFEAVDGLHSAHIEGDIISLQMHDVNEIQTFENYSFLDTGSPHHVEMVEGLKTFDVYGNGKRIRLGSPYHTTGTNVNFVEQLDDDRFAIRTYERGVEDETLSCGTGATAVALAMHQNKKTTATKIKISVEGGVLEIQFELTDKGYSQIFLSGPAEQVYRGTFKF